MRPWWKSHSQRRTRRRPDRARLRLELLEDRVQPNDLFGLSGSLGWGFGLPDISESGAQDDVLVQDSRTGLISDVRATPRPSGFVFGTPDSEVGPQGGTAVADSAGQTGAADRASGAVPWNELFPNAPAAFRPRRVADADTGPGAATPVRFVADSGAVGVQTRAGQQTTALLLTASLFRRDSGGPNLLVAGTGSPAGSLAAGADSPVGNEKAEASLGVAPDATGFGPQATRSAEYRFAAAVDPDVLSDRATEIWARVYRPANLIGSHPLILFLHGNHATCGSYPTGLPPRSDTGTAYTTTGACPAGQVIVPNHLGYAYLAEKLASWGYIVVSINANRGITAGGGITGDGGLNLARGRLILRHLQRLSTWNTTPGATPASLNLGTSGLLGQLDFGSVGLMGHSRGGEGIRAALHQYRNPGAYPGTTTAPNWPALIGPVNFQGLFEIGAVDGQTSVQLNAPDVVWNQLLPVCDGDVSDLQGVRPFDRTLQIDETNPTQKSTYTVWGANHNFYNTEWQGSDSSGCSGPGHTPLFATGDIGSFTQRRTGEASVLAFFRGNVGPFADPSFNQNFNPLYDLPDVVAAVTRVDRGFTDSPSSLVTARFEEFTLAAGTSTYGSTIDTNGLLAYTHGTVPRHAPTQRAALISWNAAAPDTYLQPNWTAPGTGVDISGYQTLEMRLSRQSSVLNPVTPTSFSIKLVMADDSLSDPVALQAYADLRGPVGGPGGTHPILQTVRIPIGDFTSADLTQVRGIRLTFDDTGSGAIYLANMRLSIFGGAALGLASSAGQDSTRGATLVPGLAPRIVERAMNTTTSVRNVPAANRGATRPDVEITLTSKTEFPVRNELAVLRIGTQEFDLSRYPDSGETSTLIFRLTAEEFDSVAMGDPIMVQYGHGEAASGERWDFGPLDKTLLRR